MKVAVVQAEAAPFQREKGLQQVEAWTGEAAAKGAELVLLPEAYVGGYPWGLAFGTRMGRRTDAGRRIFQRYWEEAVALPGPAVDRLAATAREHEVHLAVGVVERSGSGPDGTLYCTLLLFGPGGELLGKHRKLKPTAAERLVWGEGDGSTLPVVETPLGRVGGLICWENYMPLARMALYGKGVEIYLAPTADPRDRWQATLRHIAVEGRCFVLGCNQYFRRDHYPSGEAEIQEELEGWPEELCPGASSIWAPDGTCLAGPLQGEAGILLADLDPEERVRARYDFDAAGHYGRPDVFRLEVDEAPRPAVTYRTPTSAQPGEH